MANKIANWDEADQALKEIAHITRTLAMAEAGMNADIESIKEGVARQTQPIIERKKELETVLKDFALSRQGEFDKVKTRSLVYGEVGFRKASRIIVKGVKEIIARLKELGLTSCVKTTETIDKNELGKYKDSVIEKAGARRVTTEEYWYSINAEEITDNG
jgi:phage host-nuclease inhibitor protein Gam